MRLTVMLLLLLRASFSFAQMQGDSVDYYIANLDSSSVTVSTTYAPKLLFDENVTRLIALKNDSLEFKLLKNISCKKKTLAIHAILTNRHHKRSSLSESYDYKDGAVAGVNFTYNSLKWHYELSSGKSSINDDAVKYAQSYWRKKLKKKRK